MTGLKNILLLGGMVILAACSTQAKRNDQAYLQSTTIAPIQVPSDLANSSIQNYYYLPPSEVLLTQNHPVDLKPPRVLDTSHK